MRRLKKDGNESKSEWVLTSRVGYALVLLKVGHGFPFIVVENSELDTDFLLLSLKTVNWKPRDKNCKFVGQWWPMWPGTDQLKRWGVADKMLCLRKRVHARLCCKHVILSTFHPKSVHPPFQLTFSADLFSWLVPGHIGHRCQINLQLLSFGFQFTVYFRRQQRSN